jgi:hypothetical protein
VFEDASATLGAPTLAHRAACAVADGGARNHRRPRAVADATGTVMTRLVVAIAVLALSVPTLVVVGASFTAGDVVAFPPQGCSRRLKHAAFRRNRDSETG